MASLDELKHRIDLHELAVWLGLKRPESGGNYKSPHHDDKHPSLSVYKNGKAWKDFSSDEGGSCVDLVCYVRGVDIAEAIRILHEYTGLPADKPERAEDEPKREKSRAEYIADRCITDTVKAVEYLTGRGIAQSVVDRAIKSRSIGFNDWTSPTLPAGVAGHGGPAAAFIVRSLNPGHVMAVDLRYLDPDLNGGVKTRCQGEKHGYGWTSDLKRLMNAQIVYLVESPINALSVECADIPKSAAFAVRGTGNVVNIDFSWLKGKRAVIVMDNDQPNLRGIRPGLQAAWTLHERLTALDISALMVDQADWLDNDDKPVNDLNDMLQLHGAEGLKRALWKIEPWLIPGQPGRVEDNFGKRRVYLPFHDDTKYWRYRVREDFTSYVSEIRKDENGDEKLEFKDLAGFRVASLSRVTVAGATATMTGEIDTQPKVMFGISVQTPRHGATLVRRTVDDDKLHNIDTWKRIGPVWDQSAFLRMVNILERCADIGARKAANFVGLCYRDGQLVVNEGPDCYFTKPEQQCPYYNLTFPSGTLSDARQVISQYQATFRGNAATMSLVWGLGGHLKVLLGFWPHMQMQADKGHGKSTLIKRLERTIGFQMLSGQSLQTQFRLKTSVSHTSHPVGWEEISARKQEIIDTAVAMLQESYQYTLTYGSAEMTGFLLSAPVLLAGEDVPVRSLIGKLVRTELTGKKGPLLPDNLPRFPVKQWLAFLAGQSSAKVRAVYSKLKDHCIANSRASGNDDSAVRMAGNYAAILTAWRYLCEFAEIESTHGDFGPDIIREMNSHIAETSADREPWVWILETALSEMSRKEFRHPYAWDNIDGEECLLVRTSHIIEHLAHTPALRDKWNAMPVKSDRVFKKQMAKADVIVSDSIERTINQTRVSHLCALSLSRLAQFNLHATPVSSAF